MCILIDTTNLVFLFLRYLFDTSSFFFSFRSFHHGSSRVTTVLGRAGLGFQNGVTSTARVSGPRGACVCKDGSVVIADTGNNRIRRLSPDLATIDTIAGK